VPGCQGAKVPGFQGAKLAACWGARVLGARCGGRGRLGGLPREHEREAGSGKREAGSGAA
jgi:hypothetical protein